MRAEDNKLMKRRSIRSKLFSAFLLFSGIMLLILWVFQVQFLDQFYRMIKSHAVKNAAASIQQVMSDQDYKEEIESIATKNDLCVSILNEDLTEVYTSNRRDPRCMIDKLKQSEISSIYEEAITNGGNAERFIETDEARNRRMEEPPLDMTDLMPEDNPMKKEKGLQNMTYASVVKNEADEALVVLVNAQISPVDATVETIRTQLLIITAILILLGMLLAYAMSKKIAKPMITVNQKAKQLAKGDYEVSFDGNEYREISELNDTLRYAAEELSKVQQLQRDLIANMSHDLRTPLTMISGYGEMMRDIPGENTPENVQIIIDEANRLTYLVNDILDLSKLQAGVQTLQIKSCPITEIIGQVVARYTKMLEEDTCQITFIYDGAYFVQADEVKITQVIYNLINNAVTYCGDDRKVVVKQIHKDDLIRIEIIDHGEGIAEAQLPYVWERYYKSKHHKRSITGSGIGLSIVKNILELHKASYGVESELGKGSCFWLELPITNQLINNDENAAYIIQKDTDNHTI